MDKVVQQNAANAEESASASEEMSAQAQQVRGFAEELMALVNGAKAQRSARKEPDRSNRKRGISGVAQTPSPVKISSLQKQAKKKGNGKEINANPRAGGEVPPSQVIPFDDEFKDF